MFKGLKFRFYTRMMFVFHELARMANKDGMAEQELSFLLIVLRFGHAALKLKNPKVSGYNIRLATYVRLTRRYYQSRMIALAPEDDRKFLLLATEFQDSIVSIVFDEDPVQKMLDSLKVAKSRLGDDKEALGISYYGRRDYTPALLRNIMQPFLAGEAGQEETEKRLDECMARIKKLVPALYPYEHESLPTIS